MSGADFMEDDALLKAFEACELSSAAWVHKTHVRVAFIYCSCLELTEAIKCMREGIQALNAVLATSRSGTGYHETITQAFMKLIHAALQHDGCCENSEEFCTRHPALLDPTILQRYYSTDRLRSPDAKRIFLEPDLAGLEV